MRLRKKKNLEERIDACSPFLVVPAGDEPVKIIPRRWPQDTRLNLEIGCGRGRFICENAVRYPDKFFVGYERKSDAIITALERAAEMIPMGELPGQGNLRFIIDDAENIKRYFAEGSVDCLYINFCDPWPKRRHDNRRLTCLRFLELYKEIVMTEGSLFFKTDNEELFDYSITQFAEAKMYFEWQTRDLHSSELSKNNIMTEYEQNFSSKGMPIYAACLRF